MNIDYTKYVYSSKSSVELHMLNKFDINVLLECYNKNILPNTFQLKVIKTNDIDSCNDGISFIRNQKHYKFINKTDFNLLKSITNILT